MPPPQPSTLLSTVPPKHDYHHDPEQEDEEWVVGGPPQVINHTPNARVFFFSFSSGHQGKLLLLNRSCAGCRALYAVCCCNLVTIHYFRQYVIVSSVCARTSRAMEPSNRLRTPF